MKKIILKAHGPFNLRLTALSHGFCQVPPFEWNGKKNELIMAARGGGRWPVTVTICERRDGVIITAPSVADGEKLAKTVSHCLRLDEDYTGFYELCDNDVKLKDAKLRGAGRILRSPSVFEDVVKSICGTNVAWRQAVKMIHAICEFGDRTRGGGQRVFPSPEKILNAGEKWLREKARVGYRAGYIIDFCERVARGEIDLDPVDNRKLSGDELARLFLSIKGIGESTAHYLLMLHGEYGRLSIDSATHAMIKKITGASMTKEQIKRRYNRYGQWKALVMWYEWMNHSGWLDNFEA